MQRKIILWSSSSQSAVESILRTAFPAFGKVRNEIELFRELDLNHSALIVIGESIIRSFDWSEIFKKTRTLFPHLNYLFTAPGELIAPLEEEYRNSDGIDFLKLPDETLLLEEKVRRSCQPKTIILEPELLVQSEIIKEDSQSSNDYGHLLSHSKKMKDILNIINQVAETNITVLVRGESGTGKELVSRTVHARSLRMEKPFVKVLCAALPEGLLESELFGYEKGAFTGAHRRKPGKFEFANHGTIFLDEIGEIHPILQAKLLQVLQDGEFSRIGGEIDVKVDARVIAATNKQLEKAVEDGSFREDLFYRLNVVSIHLPPLRERKEEIPVLAEYFFNKYCEQYNKKKHLLSDQTLKLLQDYDWPGNIREMENTVKRMVVLENENIILQKISEKPAEPVIPVSAMPVSQPVQTVETEIKPGFSLKEVGKDAAGKAEKELIQTILNQTHWNRKKAAQLLQISYKALLYKIKKYELNDVV